MYAWANFVQDKVVSKTTIDENFVRNTTFTNVNGDYTISLGSNWNKDFKLDSVLLVQLVVLVILLMGSAFFSASETALMSISKIDARHMVDQNIRMLKL